MSEQTTYTESKTTTALHKEPIGNKGANVKLPEPASSRKPTRPPSRYPILQRAIKYLEKCPLAIKKESGNSVYFDTALKIIDGFDLSEDEATVIMWNHYNPNCQPPLNEKELRTIITNAASRCTDRGHFLKNKVGANESNKKTGRPRKENRDTKENRLNQVLNWVLSQIELFHDGISGYVTIRGEIEPTYNLDTETFAEWLTGRFFVDTGTALKSAEKIDVIATLKAKAKHGSPSKPVFIRTASIEQTLYIDLCDDQWRQVQITNTDWSIIQSQDSKVRFQRYPGMKALPVPVSGSSINILRDFLNVNDQHFMLCLTWLIQAMYGGESFPVLVINGVQGTGKTTASRVLRSLIDPSTVRDSGVPKNESDAMLAASRSWVQSWDNLSVLHNDQSDLICRMAIGGGFRTRKLFSNSEEHSISLARPIIINGIPELIGRDDLADRAIQIRLLPIGNTRRTEKEFWSQFENAKPTIFGALLDILSGVLRELPNTVISTNPKPRMLDYAHLGVAVEKTCGWSRGSFIKAYEDTRTEAARSLLDGSTVAQALISLSNDIPEPSVFAGREIRQKLIDIARHEGLDSNDRDLYNDRRFKSAAYRLNPALTRCYGLSLNWYHTEKGNVYRISRTPRNQV